MRLLRIFLLCVLIGGSGVVHAANDSRPVVGPGATKEEVINAYGWPNGQSQSGSKEILSYAQGEVVLDNGRVERVNFSPDMPWQSPRPRPPAATASTRKTAEPGLNLWLNDFAEGQREAQKRNARMLVLFTGSDWSPASREFRDQVETHPDFINAFTGDFVFVKLDFPRGSPVPATISEDLLRLRDQYQVTTYPTLLILAPGGEPLARVDLTRPGGSFRERVIDAVAEARDVSNAGYARTQAVAPLPPPPPAPAAPVNVERAAAESAAVSASPKGSTAAMTTTDSLLVGAETVAGRVVWTAGRVVAMGLFIGGCGVLLLWWWLWRQPQSKTGISAAEIAQRIDAAAGGLPVSTEMASWSKDKLCAIVAGLAEFDNYSAHIRPAGGDVDIELRKRGDVNPRVLVCCASGIEGVVPAKRVRELFGTLAAEGVDNGWYVSPSGFSNEAREYAAAHRIVLLGCESLHDLMREVPPVSLPALLARGAK